MKFIHFTDLHLVPRGEKLWGFDPVARFEACLSDLAKFHADAEFCVISGDLTDRGDIASYLYVRYGNNSTVILQHHTFDVRKKHQNALANFIGSLQPVHLR